MTEARYKIVFDGQLMPEMTLETVKDNLARLFKSDPSKIDALFSGSPVALKRDLAETEADKYLAALQQVAQLLVGLAVAVARGQVDFLKGELGVAGAAQLKAAGAEDGGQADYQQIPFHHSFFPLAEFRRSAGCDGLDQLATIQLATMLTSLPGTTMTLRMVSPSR